MPGRLDTQVLKICIQYCGGWGTPCVLPLLMSRKSIIPHKPIPYYKGIDAISSRFEIFSSKNLEI
jgi:hypothetical protein